MTVVDKHEPGTASWVDIGTDVEAAKPFYTTLFGWEAQDAGPVEETGGYGFFTKGGQMVAGYGPQQHPGPASWSVYFAVADADELAAKVTEAGGQTVVAPMDVMSAGRMAVFRDPDGAFFSVWQASDHAGAGVVREAGAMAWVELNTRATDLAKTFYPKVFGWEIRSMESPQFTYHEIHLGSESVGGIMPMPPQVPAEVPPHWLVYLGTDDVDTTAAKVTELGGQVMAGPMDYPGGRFAVVADPQGAVFGILKGN